MKLALLLNILVSCLYFAKFFVSQLIELIGQAFAGNLVRMIGLNEMAIAPLDLFV